MNSINLRIPLSTIVSAAVGVMIIATLGGCATEIKRSECEATDWYKHGEDSAMAGIKLSDEVLIDECHQVEGKVVTADLQRGFKAGAVKYCKASHARKIGENGESFEFSICGKKNTPILNAAYNEGVSRFCQKENGYSLGESGKLYEPFCPKNLEVGFLSGYRRGRALFLLIQVINLDSKIGDIASEIASLQNEQSEKASGGEGTSSLLKFQIENLIDEQKELREKSRKFRLEALGLENRKDG